MIPVALGTALGLIGAVWTGRIVAGLLFGLNPTDLRTFLAAPLLLLAAALLATYVPARRATRVEPSIALQGN
jgi:ABC-type lipoprotein release transport system permease subunit